MGWLRKFFKGSSHKFSEGHFHSSYAEDPNHYAPSTSGVSTSVTPCHSLLLLYPQSCIIGLGHATCHISWWFLFNHAIWHILKLMQQIFFFLYYEIVSLVLVLLRVFMAFWICSFYGPPLTCFNGNLNVGYMVREWWRYRSCYCTISYRRKSKRKQCDWCVILSDATTLRHYIFFMRSKALHYLCILVFS